MWAGLARRGSQIKADPGLSAPRSWTSSSIVPTKRLRAHICESWRLTFLPDGVPTASRGPWAIMLSSAGTSKEAAKELMKKFTIKQDRATGNITLFDPKVCRRTRYLRIHPELDRKTNLVSMRESVDFVFETAQACGTESHRVTVTLLAAPTKVKAIKEAPTASWLEAKGWRRKLRRAATITARRPSDKKRARPFRGTPFKTSFVRTSENRSRSLHAHAAQWARDFQKFSPSAPAARSLS